MRVTGDPDPANNGRFYIHSDHLGSTSVLTKYSDGYIRTDSLTRYAPFGAYCTGGPNPITDRAFTGQRENMSLGLYYYNARYYLPGLGRFLSADTIVPDPMNPQQYNRYAYSLNSPLNYSDPTGHDAQCWASDGNDVPSYTNCDTWMEDAIEILKNSGGADGARLAKLYESWANDTNKMLLIYAYGNNRSNMFTRFHSSDEVAIYIGWEVTTTYRRNEIALFGHELEHVDQGTLQAWSIQGEILAYKTEYRIRDTMGVGQSSRTRAVMSGDGRGSPYDPYNFDDLKDSRSGFLNTEPYNTIFEPTLPWDQQAQYQTIRGLHRASIGATAISNFMKQGVENGVSLITNIAEWVSNR